MYKTKLMLKSKITVVSFVLQFALVGCDTPMDPHGDPQHVQDDFSDDAPADPLDGFNRAMMEFNFFLDDYLLQPAATAYKALTPEFVQTGVGNFTQHIKLPFYMVNDLLQGRLDYFSQNFWIFTVNTFTGAGVINTAGYLDVYAKPNDFGLTLHRWGAGSGDAITLPILGPTCIRDAVGSVFGLFLDPVSVMATYQGYQYPYYGSTVMGVVHSRVGYLGVLENLRKESYDPYITLKSIAEQRRETELKDHQ